MERRTLTQDELAGLAFGLPDWLVSDGRLVRTAHAPSFAAGIAWVDAVAVIAEAMYHHPDIDIRYRRITFRIRTHDLDAITTWDVALAERINRVVSPV